MIVLLYLRNWGVFMKKVYVVFIALTTLSTISGVQAHQELTIMQAEDAIPDFVYKIVSIEQWQASQSQHELVLTEADDKFIHLSKEYQVSHVEQKYWPSTPHIVLKLDAKKLKGRLVYEANPNGTTKYWHLYDGAIPVDAVTEVKLVDG